MLPPRHRLGAGNQSCGTARQQVPGAQGSGLQQQRRKKRRATGTATCRLTRTTSSGSAAYVRCSCGCARRPWGSGHSTTGGRNSVLGGHRDELLPARGKKSQSETSECELLPGPGSYSAWTAPKLKKLPQRGNFLDSGLAESKFLPL